MRPYVRFGILSIAAVAACVPAVAHLYTPTIDRVEEDWELVVETPDVAGAGPQMTTTMSPDGDNSLGHVSFNLNYRDAPFRAGGLQMQIWSGESVVATNERGTAQCTTAGETITWTQRMSLSGGTLSYEVKAGESTTWGKFGQGELLDVTAPSSLTSLAAYAPAVSQAYSGVGWQSNHVTRMTLLRVRYYSGGLLVLTDDLPRPISLSN